MMDTEFITNDFHELMSGSASHANYCGMSVADEFTPFPYDLPNFTDLNQNGVAFDFPAPNYEELAEFFANDDVFGEHAILNDSKFSTDDLNASAPRDDSSPYETLSDEVDSGAATSPASSMDSDMTAIGSVTNTDGIAASPDAKKRRQNREAAKRYRMKKKTVSRAVLQEETALEMANTTLRQNIDRLEAKLAVIKDVLKHQYGFPDDSDIVLVQI